jgi:hypothetical protein
MSFDEKLSFLIDKIALAKNQILCLRVFVVMNFSG